MLPTRGGGGVVAHGQLRETEIADWSVARALRSLGQVQEALAIHQRLDAALAVRGDSDPYVSEELGECLIALGRVDEARPYLRTAYAALSADEWLVRHEPFRIERLADLAKNDEE